MLSWRSDVPGTLVLSAFFQVLFDLVLGSLLRRGTHSTGELLVEIGFWLVVLLITAWFGREAVKRWRATGLSAHRAQGEKSLAAGPVPLALHQRAGLLVGVLLFIGGIALEQFTGGVVGAALTLSHPQHATVTHLFTASGRRSSTTFVTFTDETGKERSTKLITESAVHDVYAIDDGTPLVYDRDLPTKVMTAEQYDSARHGRDALLHWGSQLLVLVLFLALLRLRSTPVYAPGSDQA